MFEYTPEVVGPLHYQACQPGQPEGYTRGTMLDPLAEALWISTLGVVGGGLTVGAYAYASRWPASRIFGSYLTAPPRPGELALTFDDGPNPAWTPRLLEILASHNVQATFFVVGSYAQAEAGLLRQIASHGHLIGSHAWSHVDLSWSRGSTVLGEIERGKSTLEDLLGQPVRYFRPPFGARRPMVAAAARQMGMVPVLWNAMTTDWSLNSPDAVERNLARRIDALERRGYAANIVLHDGSHLDPAANREPSVTAAGRLLLRYKDSHRFVRIDEWA